jgi:hypothetical protein
MISGRTEGGLLIDCHRDYSMVDLVIFHRMQVVTCWKMETGAALRSVGFEYSGPVSVFHTSVFMKIAGGPKNPSRSLLLAAMIAENICMR